MIRVLITGSGGSIGLDVARALGRFRPDVALIGTDHTVRGRGFSRRLCDKVVPVPPALDRNYLSAVEEVVDHERIDVVFMNPDHEIDVMVKADCHLPCITSYPGLAECKIALDKFLTFEKVRGRVAVPHTVRIDDDADLEQAFEQCRGEIWLRPTTGAGGKGAILARTLGHARVWMESWRHLDGIGNWIAQEYLPGRNYNWTGVWREGRLLAQATMERVRYFLGEVTVSGISGQVSLCRTVTAPAVESAGIAAVKALSDTPHGIYSADFRENAAGAPCLNEINPRLAGRPSLYDRAGLNLPALFIQAFTGVNMRVDTAANRPRSGLVLARQLDMEPLFYEDATEPT